VASLSQGRTAAAQCGLFTHKSVPVIFEPPCIYSLVVQVKKKITDGSKQAEGYKEEAENSVAHVSQLAGNAYLFSCIKSFFWMHG